MLPKMPDDLPEEKPLDPEDEPEDEGPEPEWEDTYDPNADNIGFSTETEDNND